MKNKGPVHFVVRLKRHIRQDKKSFVGYTVLRVLVILTAVRCLFTENYEGFSLCILSLILFLLPALFEEWFHIDIPTLFEITIYAFIFAAEILGEVNKYYTAIPGWDTMLHTLNGFLCAAIGISLVYIIDQKSEMINLSPFYLALVSFCFSMTIGVIWEFIEFGADQLLQVDMQKDMIVQEIGSVTLDPDQSQKVIHISNIVKTIVQTADGAQYEIPGGYLDIGIKDTMKDLFVNLIGAGVYTAFGYLYLKRGTASRKRSLARALMLRPAEKDENRHFGDEPGGRRRDAALRSEKGEK